MSKSTLFTAYQALLRKNRLGPNSHQAALITKLASLQDELIYAKSERACHRGIYVYGNVGTGKSRIVDLFASTLPSSVSCRRVHFNEFMIDIHLRLHHARSQASFQGDPLLQIGRDIRNESRVLCFDEFQVTDIADAMILQRLFGAIWESGGVMVSTSNRSPGKLYENGLNRSLFLPFITELEQQCEIWRMKGDDDYRRKGVEAADRVDVFFLHPAQFKENLDMAKMGSHIKEITIPVLMSRLLKVEAASLPDGNLIISSTFSELCEGFKGSADYIALCKKAKTIFISGLRRFEADELDFVRRFIMLVDVAYESRTRIVCLSDVPLLEVFNNIIPNNVPVEGELLRNLERQMTVKGEGGSSSSMMSTFIGEMEWSATGLSQASLASGGAGETDVKFAIGRAVSRLFEMGSTKYGVKDSEVD